MTQRKLIAALACRSSGQRLYGKPLQNLEPGYSIIQHILNDIDNIPDISESVLGIAEGPPHQVFLDVAEKNDLSYVFGSERDVLWRLILCARITGATDVFRITTECPFIAWEFFTEAWQCHIEHDNDITVTDYLPEGMNFEIYKLSALLHSHENGRIEEQSEYCSAYARRCSDQFKITLMRPPEQYRRLDLRLTVDQPEDLILCRNVYTDLKECSPNIPSDKIITYLDTRPDLKKLVSSYVDSAPVWANSIPSTSILALENAFLIKEKI